MMMITTNNGLSQGLQNGWLDQVMMLMMIMTRLLIMMLSADANVKEVLRMKVVLKI